MTTKSPNVLLNEALLICTRNRLNELDSLATTLNLCSFIPEYIVLIDASDKHEKSTLTSLFSIIKSKLIISASEIASIPFQRNLGVSLLPNTCEIVHFIDDDFLPNQDYFFYLSQFLIQNKNKALGAGGRILPISIKNNLTVFDSIFGLNASEPGIVLPSGRTTESQAILHSSFSYTSLFLSGCSMSFFFNIFSSFKFDETLQGYAQDEDLAFCLQLPRNSIFVVPYANGKHQKSITNRLNNYSFKKMSVINRFYVMNTYAKNYFSIPSFHWSLLGQLIILCKSPIKNSSLIKGLLAGWMNILTMNKLFD